MVTTSIMIILSMYIMVILIVIVTMTTVTTSSLIVIQTELKEHSMHIHVQWVMTCVLIKEMTSMITNGTTDTFVQKNTNTRKKGH